MRSSSVARWSRSVEGSAAAPAANAGAQGLHDAQQGLRHHGVEGEREAGGEGDGAAALVRAVERLAYRGAGHLGGAASEQRAAGIVLRGNLALRRAAGDRDRRRNRLPSESSR